jgi:hypothetical protein
VKGLPDSGFFVDYPSMVTGKNEYLEKMKTVFNIANQEISPPNQKCVAAN